LKKLEKSIKLFEGIHDFEYFSKKGSEPISTIREIYKTKVYRYKEFYIFKFKANSFLRSQIRMMVQFLLDISDEKLTDDDLLKQLNKKGIASNKLSPPNGLYLSKIIY
jgi:tRNA pseudouridine38-40 synthase